MVGRLGGLLLGLIAGGYGVVLFGMMNGNCLDLNVEEGSNPVNMSLVCEKFSGICFANVHILAWITAKLSSSAYFATPLGDHVISTINPKAVEKPNLPLLVASQRPSPSFSAPTKWNLRYLAVR
jgi:hypothetical protein